MSDREKIHLEKIDDYRWRIPKTGKMRVDGVIYADERLLREIHEDESLKQVANVAHLPGIQGYSLAMPDIHWGYGFPIGGSLPSPGKRGSSLPAGWGMTSIAGPGSCGRISRLRICGKKSRT